MRLLALSGLLLVLVPVPAGATTDVTVTLSVQASVTFPFDEPAFTATCSVTVPTGSKAADALDAASCIDGWSGIDYGGSLGRYLTGIEGNGIGDSTDAGNPDSIRFVCGAFGLDPGGAVLYSFWGFSVDGDPTGVGVDNHVLAHGEELRFHYVVDACPSLLYAAYLVGGTWPHSPERVEGDDESNDLAGLEV